MSKWKASRVLKSLRHYSQQKSQRKAKIGYLLTSQNQIKLRKVFKSLHQFTSKRQQLNQHFEHFTAQRRINHLRNFLFKWQQELSGQQVQHKCHMIADEKR